MENKLIFEYHYASGNIGAYPIVKGEDLNHLIIDDPAWRVDKDLLVKIVIRPATPEEEAELWA